MTRYRVYIRDALYQRVDPLESWISLKAVRRFNAVGSLALTLAANDPSATLLTKQGGIIIARDLEDGSEPVTVWSGGHFTEYTRTETMLKVVGRCDNTLLETLARPTPSLAEGPYPAEQWVYTAQASSALYQIVAVNIGASAPDEWKIPNLALKLDPLTGDTITLRARFESLLQILTSAAVSPEAGGLGFEIRQSDVDPDTIDFGVYAPRDQRDVAKFGTDLGTASDYQDTWKSPPANWFHLLIGDALGEDRTILEGGDAASIAEVGRRIDAIIEARGVTDPAEGLQRLNEAIAGGVPSRQVTVTPLDDIRSLRYGVEWELGDLVQASVNGEAIPKLVREIEFNLTTNGGAIVKPMLGDASTSNDGLTGLQIRAINQRVAYLEANWDLPAEGVKLPMLAEPARVPVGQIGAFAGAVPPAGWVLANGQAISRTTYADLFAQIGTGYGAGNGTTTFNVPNLVNRIIVGAGGTYGIGATGTFTPSPHTHPGTHDHGYDHDHEIDHNHTAFDATVENTTDGTDDIDVEIDVPSYSGASGDSDPGTTDGSSLVFAADYVGATGPAYFAAMPCIYTGTG